MKIRKKNGAGFVGKKEERRIEEMGKKRKRK